MPELLRSAKLAIEKGQAQGRDETYVKQLADYIIPALVEALQKVILTIWLNDIGCCMMCKVIDFLAIGIIILQEPETEICASMLDSLNECMQVLP